MSAAATKKSNGNFLEKAVFTFVAIVFTSVSLWLGTTVSAMSKEVTKLTVTIENQVKLSDSYKRSLDVFSERLHGVEIQLAKQTDIRKEIERLRNRMDQIEKKR